MDMDREFFTAGEVNTTPATDAAPKDVVVSGGIRMRFSISHGRLSIAASGFSMTLDATSGRGGCMNNNSRVCQSASFEGPIPVGHYTIYPREISNPNPIKDIARTLIRGDWGDWRVRLHEGENPGFDIYGRSGFFLHGGALAGSAGCIDVGGGVTGDDNTNLILGIITAFDDPIPVEVIR